MDSEPPPLSTPASRVLLGLGGEVYGQRPEAALAAGEDTLRNGWWRSCNAVHLLRGSRWKHLFKKSLPSSERSSGRGGSSSEQAILVIIETKENCGKFTQGGHPWHISTTVQPRDQISEGKLCSTPCNASGAIQKGVPLKSDEDLLEVPRASTLLGSIESTPRSSSSSDTFLAKLKSAIFTDSEEEPTKRFCPLISQWTISWAWRYVKPSTKSLVNLRTCGK